MALMSLLSRNRAQFSQFQTHPQPKCDDSRFVPSRRFHIEPGPREKALLEEDPALKRFRSNKKSVLRLKRVGDVLTIVVVAGCCYEIYVKTVMRKAAREAADANNSGA